MAQIIGLQTLSTKLAAGTRTASGRGSALLVTFLVLFAGLEGIATLKGRGLGVALMLAMRAYDHIVAGFVLSMIAQIALVGMLWRSAARSGLQSIIGADLASIATFGVGRSAEASRRRLQRLVSFGALVLAFMALVWPWPGVTGSGGWLNMILALTFPVVAAWVVTVLIFRGAGENSILIGLAAAVVVGLLSGAFTPQASIFLMRDGFLVTTQLVLLNADVLVAAIIFTHGGAEVLTLVAEDAAQAPPLVEYSPFSEKSPPPRYLSFQTNSGQLLALTRGLNAPTYQLADVSDTHALLPIFDRSLLIWNITRLARSLPQTVELLDTHGYFKLTLELGSLALPAGISAGARFDKPAVDIANDAIFKNPDFAGLLKRGAAVTLNAQVAPELPAIEEIIAILDDPPSKLTVSREVRHDGDTHALRIELDRLNVLIDQANAYREKLKECNTKFREIVTRASSVDAADLEQKWLRAIVADFTRAAGGIGRANSVNFGEAVRVLSVVGIRANGVHVTLAGRAAECGNRLTTARAEIEAQVDQAEKRVEGLQDRIIALRDDITKETLRTNPLTRAERTGMINHTVGGASVGSMKPAQQVRDSAPAEIPALETPQDEAPN